MSNYDLFNPPPEALIRKRDAILDRVQTKAGTEFAIRARKFIVSYLLEHGETPGEVLTDAAKLAGIIPDDDRAFGSVYMSLSRSGVIAKTGFCMRRKGNCTAGGNVWGLKKTE